MIFKKNIKEFITTILIALVSLSLFINVTNTYAKEKGPYIHPPVDNNLETSNEEQVCIEDVAENEVVQTPPEMEEEMERTTKYLEKDPEGRTIFNIVKARQDNLSIEEIEAMEKINQFGLAVATGQVSKEDPQSISLRGFKFKWVVWGNWCGPGHGGGMAKDKLDSLCMAHDKCYDKKGYFACSCDRVLVATIKKNYPKMKKGMERILAAKIASFFKSSPCNPFK